MLHDVIGGYQAYIQRKKDLFIYLWSLEFRSWLRPRAVSRLRARFARDKIMKSLRSEWPVQRAPGAISLEDHMKKVPHEGRTRQVLGQKKACTALLEKRTDRRGFSLRQKNSKTQRSCDKMVIDWVR